MQVEQALPMKRRVIMTLIAVGMILLTSGCKSLFPSKTSVIESRWKSYATVEADFAKITPHFTTTNDLRILGFYPSASPNVKVLTYVDIIQLFMPNPGIRLKDLAPGVRECIEGREQSWAYQIDLETVDSHRYGSLFLDVLGFKRKTHEDGWSFKGLVLIKDGVITYKLSSGEPQVSRNDTVNHPLGPFQELEGSALSIINISKF